jgi:DNA-binding response OmpR family regulator
MAKVLVVEDDRDVREMIAELLRSSCVVTLAENGTDALKMLTGHRRKFDAVIVDLEMPGGGGVALLSRMRERGMAVPALVVSGMPDANRQATNASADFIAKPFDVEELEGKVRQLLRKVS